MFDVSFSFINIYSLLSIQVFTCDTDNIIEFIRLEELKVPIVVRGMSGEEGMEW